VDERRLKREVDATLRQGDQTRARRAAKETGAQALITLTSQKELPRRFIAGADAIGTAAQKVALLQQQINAYRELSTSLAYEDA
jgi:hypothetical protein